MPVRLPPCPTTLRSIQHHLKTALEHDERDPVVSYWCRLCALQSALKIDKKSDEAKVFLMSLMDWLESTKSQMHDNDSVTNDVAAQAYIENYALKLFLWADSQDRAGVFNKNVVKAFYTAGILMDILTVFGELSDEISANCKYAKWKAAYIHNCLKNGEMPIPGPMQDEDENNTEFFEGAPSSSSAGGSTPANIGFHVDPSPGAASGGSLPDPPNTLNFSGYPPASSFSMPNTSGSQQPNTSFNAINDPRYQSNYKVAPTPVTPTSELQDDNSSCTKNLIAKETGKQLEPEQITRAQKYCKWAISALNYDDVSEAVSNIQKALKLLETGDES